MIQDSGFCVGQVGAKIILDTLADLSGATSCQVWWKNSISSGKWTGVLEGNTVTYTTQSISDFSTSGVWVFQAYVEGFTFKTPGKPTIPVIITANAVN